MSATSLRRRIGLPFAVLLGLSTGYDLIWHLVNGLTPPLVRLAPAPPGVAAMVLAVSMRRDTGPRWPLRVTLLLCSAVLSAEVVVTLLRDAAAQATASMMDLETVGSAFEWGTAVLLALALLALVGSWPRERAASSKPSH